MIEPPPIDHRLDPDHLPTPFSADQIRRASVPGTRVAFRIQPAGAPGHVDVWEFLGGDQEFGERRRWTLSIDGAVIEEPEVARSSWLELQRHASYPAATTTLESGEVTIGPGTFECWVYVVADPDSGSVTRAWFAPSMPGPPIVLESRAGDAVTFRMELIELIRPT